MKRYIRLIQVAKLYFCNHIERILESFSAHWKSPSNIALVKYWGKKDVQLPMNPSISFTLTECHTDTELTAYTDNGSQSVRVWVDDKETPSFVPKIDTFLNRIRPLIPEIKDLRFEIRTRNTFPHSSGIASSASGMSALALCMYDVAMQNGRQLAEISTVSEMARLGSGSASRSLFGEISVWGEHQEFPGSSDHFAIPFTNQHKIFSTYRDAILIVDSGAKEVSSTVGHQLLNNHPFAVARFDVARKNMSRIKPVLEQGDLAEFVEIVESEALMLHALMMTSNPGFVLMKPETLRIIDLVRAYRQENDSSLCFTLDAGANVHLLYPENEHPQVLSFIKNELKQFCADGYYICDRIGKGPVRIK